MLIFDGDNPFPDENCSTKRTRGGGLTGAKRCEYMALCQQLTSCNPGLDYQPILDRMFAILKEDVLEHIGTLSDKKTLVADIETIFTGIPKDASGKYVTTDYIDYLRIYNIVSFQIACLFTDYYKDVTDNSTGNSDNKYNELLTKDYKNYLTIKTALLSDSFIKNTEEFHSFIQLGDITISGIVEYLFNHIYVASLAYELQYLHDIKNVTPLGIIHHDKDHFKLFDDNYKYIDTILEGFLPYIKGLNLDKQHKYAIYFILFAFLHESDLWSPLFPEKEITVVFLENNLQNEEVYSQYLNINDHAMAIPSMYREFEEGSDTQIKLNKVQAFFTFAIETFMTHYTAFRATKEGGRRRKRKTNKKRRKAGRKRKTHRRSK